MATRKKPETGAALDKGRRSSQGGDGASELAAQTDGQIEALEQGIRLFRQQEFAKAREFFEKAAKGPVLSVSHTAKNHIAVCERRTQKPTLELRTADDHYNYAVERLNARDLEIARKHLEVALALRPESDHILYAFAAVLALSGDTAGSYENLRRAIDAEPRNRHTARHDPDFAVVSHHPLFAQLLHPEKYSG